MEVIIDDRDEKTDANGRTYIMEVIAYKVPQTEKYPSGTKYSFHANYKNPKRTNSKIRQRKQQPHSKTPQTHQRKWKRNNQRTPKQDAKQLKQLFQQWAKEVNQIVNQKT